MRNRAQIVERARLHVGHKEATPNDSFLIRAWLRRCGVTKPSAWCAAFASWCVEEREQNGGDELVDVKSASVLRLAALFPETSEPQPGDLMWFPTDDQGHGHVGIVVGVSDDEVLCIEGNSANRVRYVRRLRSEVRFASTRPLERWAGAVERRPTAPLVHVSFEGTR